MRVLNRFVLLASLLAALHLAARPARAECPVFTQTAGPSFQYRLNLSKEGLGIAPLTPSFDIGASYAINFLPNSNCTVRWLTLSGELLLGGGSSTVNPLQGAFDVVVAASVGTYNDLISFGVGVPLVNVGAPGATGLVVGALNPADVYLLAGFHLTFELGPNGLVFSAPKSGAPAEAPCSERPGCVVL